MGGRCIERLSKCIDGLFRMSNQHGDKIWSFLTKNNAMAMDFAPILFLLQTMELSVVNCLLAAPACIQAQLSMH
jgi:hypothetical protein